MLKEPLHISVRRRTGMTSSVAGGFSLLELLIVVAISITLAAIAIPSFLSAYYDIRLKAACSDLSGFMQRVRIQAAKQNATYSIGYRPNGGVEEAYIDLNNSGAWDPGEPILTFNAAVTPAPGAPNGGR
jgi:Tfp pilus assembly protein FimT